MASLTFQSRKADDPRDSVYKFSFYISHTAKILNQKFTVDVDL